MRRLLLVEDEDHLRCSMVANVPWKQLGIGEVRAAACGGEALSLLHDFKPDILLTDIRMPGISGIELAEDMLTIYPDLRIVFISAYSEKEYLHSALRMGSVDYLFKPIQMEDLYSAITRAMTSLHQMRRNQGSAQLVESYSEQLVQPFLVHLLQGTQPIEQLFGQLESLPIGVEKGTYIAILLYPIHTLPKDCYDAAIRLLSFPGLAYCRLISPDKDRQVLLLCFDQPPTINQLEGALRQLTTRLQVSGFVTAQVQHSPTTTNLLDLYGFAGQSMPNNGKATQQTRVHSLCDQMVLLIHQSYTNHSFGAGSIAKELHYTNAYICTVFKQRFGITIHDYINIYRIAKAKELLEATSENLATIAQQVGYENDSYFSRVFKKSEGISPSDYRRRHKR